MDQIIRQILLQLVRRRGRRSRESVPRPERGAEQVVVDSNADIVIDGVPIGRNQSVQDRGNGRALKIIIIVLAVLLFLGLRFGSVDGLSGRLQDLWEEISQTEASTPRTPRLPNMPQLPDTHADNPSSNNNGPSSNDVGPDDPDSFQQSPGDPLSKKNQTY